MMFAWISEGCYRCLKGALRLGCPPSTNSQGGAETQVCGAPTRRSETININTTLDDRIEERDKDRISEDTGTQVTRGPSRRAPSSAARTCYSDTPTVPRAGAGVLAHLGVVPRRRPAHLGVVYGRMPLWDKSDFGTSERGGQCIPRCRGRPCTGIAPPSHDDV